MTHSSQSGDIDAGEKSRDTRGRFVNLTEPIETRIRDRDAGLLRVDGGVWEIGSFA